MIREALEELYGYDLLKFGVEENTLPQGEGRKPVDRRYGTVLVEFKWNMNKSRCEHGSKQALEYLEQLEATTNSIGKYTALVCDGKQWGFLIERRDTESRKENATERQSASHFEWRQNSTAAVRRFLQICGDHTLTPLTGNNLAQVFSPKADSTRHFVAMLAVLLEGKRMGDRPDTLFCEWRRSTEVAYGSLDSHDQAIGVELREHFDIPANHAESLAEILFLVHTYFAFIARIIAIESLAIALNDHASRPSGWGTLTDDPLHQMLIRLDKGQLPNRVTVANLFEADVFGWWTPIVDEEVLNSVRNLLNNLSQFAFPRTVYGTLPASDLLRELYIRLIPQPLRKRLGEYPTPMWLAEACLEAVKSGDSEILTKRVLDPCCGTGAFLLPVLRQRVIELRTDNSEKVTSGDVQKVLDDVVGFDINPLAVVATRANFLITLGPLAEIGEIALRVWRTDSIVLPDTTPAQGVLTDERLTGNRYLELHTSAPEAFPIPEQLTKATQISLIRNAIEQNLDDLTGLESMIATLSGTLGPHGKDPCCADDDEWHDICQVLEVLYERISILAEKGRNGVWAGIIANSFAPMFAGKFDLVVGNPPWLGYSKLPLHWRTDAERLWRKYGLWTYPVSADEKHKGRAQYNDIAALVHAVSLDRYATDNGTVAFLVPDNLIIGDPGARAWRKFHYRSDSKADAQTPVDVEFAVTRCEDWSRVKPFGNVAANRPVFVVTQRGLSHTFPVPGFRWKRTDKGSRLHSSWAVVKDHLVANEGQYDPADSSLEYSAWSFRRPGTEFICAGSNFYKFGMGVNTRGAAGVYHVKVLSAQVSSGTVKIENLKDDGRNKDVVVHSGSVESTLVHPFFRGRDIRKWSLKRYEYMILPQDPESFTAPLSEKKMATSYPKTLAWLKKHKVVLKNRSRPNSSWNMERDWFRVEGPFAHFEHDYAVVVPEQELPPCSAILTLGPYDKALGRRCMMIPNHKVVMCSVPTLDEAVYLCAILNSTHVGRFIESFASSIAVSPTTLSRIGIPQYRYDDFKHTAVVEIGKSILGASDVEPASENFQGQLDDAVKAVFVG